MLLFQTSRAIIFYFQHFIQVWFYLLGKNWGGARPPPGPSPCYGTEIIQTNVVLCGIHFFWNESCRSVVYYHNLSVRYFLSWIVIIAAFALSKKESQFLIG